MPADQFGDALFVAVFFFYVFFLRLVCYSEVMALDWDDDIGSRGMTRLDRDTGET